MGWYRRALNVLRPRRAWREIDRELSFHLAERIDELREGGMSAAEAADTARRQFGPYRHQVERTRDADISWWLESTLRNGRLAVRALTKAPGFSITAILTLALGIGANSAVFSAIDAVLLRPLPFPQADRLVRLSQSHPEATTPFLAPARLEDWNRLNDTFQAISGYYVDDVSELSGELPERLTRAFVARRFLDVWGIPPALGRGFSEEEQRFGGPRAVLISDRFWRRRFAADPGAVGRTLQFGQSGFTVVGVMPATFRFPVRDTDVWTPSPADSPYAQNRAATWFTAIGRLAPGVPAEKARANLAAVQAALGREYPETDAALTPVVEPLKAITVARAGRSLWILFGSVTLLLVIACTNLAALLLSRAASRQHEIALRFSLGASRASVAAHLLTEVLILAIAGSGVGLLLAAAATAGFRTLAGGLPRVDEIGIDWRIVLYSLACALAATVACGLVPALRATRRELAGPLAQAGRTAVRGRHRVQFVLVGVQVALAVMLLAGAGLLARSLQELGRVSPGFDPAQVLTFRLTTTWGETADPEAVRQRTERILE
ncbi:MAG TPA: ABC transporter permease, partial [Vicinamibacterales bacterium]|nr:ABC transporter permease [Vicinamibacterales bacterium]